MTTSNKDVIAFQGGGLYTERGQRIAAMRIDRTVGKERHTGVIMLDIDRGIEYFFVDCTLNKDRIMQRYWYNEGRCVPYNLSDIAEIRDILRAAAGAVPTLAVVRGMQV